MSRYYLTAFLLAVLSVPALAADEPPGLCGNPFVTDNGIGPWDYLDPYDRNKPERIPTVERYHFNTDVQTGRAGMTASVLGDLHYVLKMSPNHHRALYSLINYHLKNDPVVPYPRSVDCYLDRARVFRPDDGTVHMLDGIYAARIDDLKRAETSYKRALELIPDSSELHYNLGLLYFERGDLASANEHAVRAYSLGSRLPGLKRKLVRRGAWDPEVLAEPQVNETEGQETDTGDQD